MKKFSVFVACLTMVGLLAGCGSKFDAAGYTKALLDNAYKNDSTQYVKMKIGTAEEAAKFYEEGIDSEMEALTTAAGDSISEEQIKEFREVIADIIAGAKYKVGDAELQDDKSYVVTITYEQMQIYSVAAEAFKERINVIMDEWQATAEAGGGIPSNDEMIATIMDEFVACFKEAIPNATYAEPQTTTIRIELNSDNAYEPNADDIQNLEKLLFDIENVDKFFEGIR